MPSLFPAHQQAIQKPTINMRGLYETLDSWRSQSGPKLIGAMAYICLHFFLSWIKKKLKE